ncbi:hypothetical protein N7463_002049 [Penicillium fimorum]|uniref:AMP-dependent synthetase/ligase domain-containing protein n=1 Tax=Penicillium fimorum TaxID=1882269 RepID=A0A9W9XYH5_9EURO|nr:hypothetical protein N7463_002049 [Penicillium fimorum]
MTGTTLLEVPQGPFFDYIFHRWQTASKTLLIRDVPDSKEANVERFLFDVLTVKENIYYQLDDTARLRLKEPDVDVFVAVLADAGYSFAVLLFALYALGATAVPLSPNVLPEEGCYTMQLCNASLLATVPKMAKNAEAIAELTGTTIFSFDMMLELPANLRFKLQSGGTPIESTKGFVLLQTSGTTGLPKGVLHTRRAAEMGVLTRVESLRISEDDIMLHTSPVHWLGGFLQCVTGLMSGACIEFCRAVFSLDWLTQRLQKGDVRSIFLHPKILDALAEKVSMIQRTWPLSQSKALLNGIGSLRMISTGGMRVHPSTQARWEKLNGRPLVVAYGMTETLGLVSMKIHETAAEREPNCCGSIMPYMDVKISDTGEICIKGPVMFKKYLSHNAKIMHGVFDSEGYYKTGDIGRIQDGLLFVVGRASHDVIRFDGWKIYAPEVEDALEKHPLVASAIVVGVPDRQFGYRVGALLVVKDPSKEDDWDPCLNLNLSGLQRWLALERQLLAYKMPTLLRLLRAGDTLPTTTTSGKIQKPKIVDSFFSGSDVASGHVESGNFVAKEGEYPRPFDWAGI